MPDAPASSLPSIVVPATLDVPAVPDILEEHLEELGYLYLQRRKQCFCTDVPLRRLTDLDGRIAAHWEGLVLGGGTTVEVALGHFEDSNPWIAAAAVRVWLELGRPERDQILEKLTEVPEPALGIWREAFRRLPLARLVALATCHEAPKQPMPLRLLLADAYAWNAALASDVAIMEVRQGPPTVRAAVSRHLVGLPKDPMWSVLATELVASEEPAVVRGALWSLGLLDRQQALRLLRAHMAGPAVALDPARLLLCGIFGERQDAATLLSLGGEIAAVAAATRAVGELGGLEHVGSLLERLGGAAPEVVSAAAAALERLLGPLTTLVPSAQDEAAETPPPPDVAAVKAEVDERKSKLAAGTCYLDGRPYPWTEPPREEPLAWLWRGNVRGERADLEWMRREIPDGVLDGEWAMDARVGE